jgi:hypothetical protein
VILVDANLALYAYNEDSVEHASARAWLEGTLSGDQQVGLPWHTLLAFLRITTNPRLFPRYFSIEESCAIVDEWLQMPQVAILQPGERHWSILQRMLTVGQAAGNLASDAHLAALAIEHGALLCTTDRDFARFPGLRWENPLQA